MNMDVINKIEAKISELEAQFKKNNDFILGANSNMEKLISDKALATNECNIINGAVQMAKGILAEMKVANSPNSDVLPCDDNVLTCSAE